MLPVEPGAAGVHTRSVRVLFASTAGAGHFHPLKPFVEACLRQGDDVLVAGPPALADSVAGAGYAYWRVDEPPPDELGEVWSRVASASVWRRWTSSRWASWPRRSTSYAARSAWRPIRAPRRCAAPHTSRWSRRRWRIPRHSSHR